MKITDRVHTEIIFKGENYSLISNAWDDEACDKCCFREASNKNLWWSQDERRILPDGEINPCTVCCDECDFDDVYFVPSVEVLK